MRYTFDPNKAASNFVKHSVAFDVVEGFEWETALVRATLNHDTSEPRLFALGLVGEQLYAVAYSIETASVRIISMRRANNREIKRYEAGN